MCFFRFLYRIRVKFSHNHSSILESLIPKWIFYRYLSFLSCYIRYMSLACCRPCILHVYDIDCWPACFPQILFFRTGSRGDILNKLNSLSEGPALQGGEASLMHTCGTW